MKVALLLDNCSAHKPTFCLKNISLFFLPPNTTSILQLCDIGIIKSTKSYFKHEIRINLIDVLGDTPEDVLVAQTVLKCINLLKAMHMIKGALAKFPVVTIQNS